MADGDKWAIFDDAEDTTLILHVGKSELSIAVSDDHIEFVFIDAEMKRSSVVDWCDRSDDVRSLFSAMMEVQEARDGGR